MTGLTKTRGTIIKVMSRDRSGRNIHKNEFPLDNSKAVEEELRTWKDKLGVPISTFANIVNNPINKSELDEVKSLMEKDIIESNKKVKEMFSKV